MGDVVPRALAWLRRVLAVAPSAGGATRRQARQPLFDAFATVDGAVVERMLDAWFSEETQGAMRALVARRPASGAAMTLAGKTLFITGASRGIGLAIALRAARDGANVVIAAKTTEPHPKLPGTIYTAAGRSRRRAARRLPRRSTSATRPGAPRSAA